MTTARAARSDEEHRREVRATIRRNATFDEPFVIMNVTATVVAGYGLLLDSTATVIGAMVIATFLNAITGVSLALVDGDRRLLGRALRASLGGILIVIGISALIGAIHPSIPLGNETLSRTHPNILDLIIGLAGGAAGAYATASPRVSAGLVGVAIATALVPPLASCGLCLSRGEWSLALGAAELFLTNFAAIQVSTSVVMWLLGYKGIRESQLSLPEFVRRNAISLVFLGSLAVVLGINLGRSISDQLLESYVRDTLGETLGEIPGASIIRTTFDHRDAGVTKADVVVLTPEDSAPHVAALLERDSHVFARANVEVSVMYILGNTIGRASDAETIAADGVVVPSRRDPTAP